TYTEAGGTPVLTVAGTVPLMATFGDDGKTITIGAAPQAVEKPRTPAQPVVAAPQIAAPGVAVAPPGPAVAPPRPRFLVVIDPAHGGDDRGAVLEAGFNEKDLTLTIARKLRTALDRAGITAVLLRDGDTTLTADDRAIAANTARAAVYIGVHAGSVGRGVRIYTARMSANLQPAGTMAPWNMAQAAYLDRSRELADGIAAQLAQFSVDHAEGSAQLQPLPHLTSAAVEVEVLPDKGGIASLQSAEYQQRICAALAEAIAAGRRTLEARK
ncbi:MAG: N-acetylmuramoyl-L-alanine amidase, partial [Terriglobales bacterium]